MGDTRTSQLALIGFFSSILGIIPAVFHIVVGSFSLDWVALSAGADAGLVCTREILLTFEHQISSMGDMGSTLSSIARKLAWGCIGFGLFTSTIFFAIFWRFRS